MNDTSITLVEELVETTRNLLNAVRGSSIKIGENLYEIRQQLPKEKNWGDFLRDQFDISEGFASKLMTIHRVFVLEGGISHAKLETIDSEKLYLARNLDGTAEEKLAQAQTLTRRELKEQRAEEDNHEHKPITICETCHVRL